MTISARNPLTGTVSHIADGGEEVKKTGPINGPEFPSSVSLICVGA